MYKVNQVSDLNHLIQTDAFFNKSNLLLIRLTAYVTIVASYSLLERASTKKSAQYYGLLFCSCFYFIYTFSTHRKRIEDTRFAISVVPY